MRLLLTLHLSLFFACLALIVGDLVAHGFGVYSVPYLYEISTALFQAFLWSCLVVYLAGWFSLFRQRSGPFLKTFLHGLI